VIHLAEDMEERWVPLNMIFEPSSFTQVGEFFEQLDSERRVPSVVLTGQQKLLEYYSMQTFRRSMLPPILGQRKPRRVLESSLRD